MKLTTDKGVAVLKEQITKSQQTLNETRYNPAPVRERVAGLARRYGSPALDMGTGVCACMEMALTRLRLRVTAVDYASSVRCISQEQAAGKLSETMDVNHADMSHLPFLNGSYRVTVAFVVLSHASYFAVILGEMFHVSKVWL